MDVVGAVVRGVIRGVSVTKKRFLVHIVCLRPTLEDDALEDAWYSWDCVGFDDGGAVREALHRTAERRQDDRATIVRIELSKQNG